MKARNATFFVPAILVFLPGLTAAAMAQETGGAPGAPTTSTVNADLETNLRLNQKAATTAAPGHKWAPHKAAAKPAQIVARTGPGMQYGRVASIARGAKVTVLERSGSWVNAKLPGGKTGWVRSDLVTPVTATAVEEPAAATAGPGTTEATAAAAGIGAAKPAAQPNAAAKTKPAAKAPAETAPVTLAADTKADPLAGTQDSPAASAGDAGRLLLYLVPIVGLIMLGVRGLKTVQERTGKIPSLKQSIVGGFNVSNARKSAGSSIRVRESMPLGTVSLHLVEVRGRMLLIGTSGSSVTLLTEIKEDPEARNAEFQSLLNTAVTDIRSLDEVEDFDGSLGAVVGSLDQSLREARENIARRATQARQWNEVIHEGENDDISSLSDLERIANGLSSRANGRG